MSQHAREKDWFSQVSRATFEEFPTREMARTAETKAIASESPLHNVIGKREPLEGSTAPGGVLCGRWFLSDAHRGWQGQVAVEVRNGVYLVQLYDWLMGERSTQRMVDVDEMCDWSFYDSAEEMRFAYDRAGVGRRWERERAEEGVA